MSEITTPVTPEAPRTEVTDPAVEALYKKVRERRHRSSGAVIYDVTYGATDRYGHPKYPGNGDGHGHRIYLVLNGEEYPLFEREPDQENKQNVTRELDEKEWEEAQNAPVLKELDAALLKKKELVHSAEMLSRRGEGESEQISMEELQKSFAAMKVYGTEWETELSQRMDRAKEQYEKRAEERSVHKEAKEALIKEAETLAETTDWKGAEEKLNDQMERWKQIGSAGVDEDQGLWEQFNSHRQKFYQRRKEHFDELKSKRAEAREQKLALIEEAKAAAADLSSFKDASARMNELFDRWKAAGSAGHSTDEKLWEQFNAIRQEFKEKRNAFYSDRDANRGEVAKKKEEILRKAQLISASKDYSKENSEAMKQFNVEWKAAGSAGHEVDEKLWLEYRKAQDAFWEGKHEEHAAARKEYTDKLESSIQRKESQIENLQNQIYHLKDKMHAVQNPGYLINMEGWVQEKEKAIKELKAQVEQMQKRL